MGSTVPTHVIGFDDAPFPAEHRGDVMLVGAVFCGVRLEGVLCGKVRRDGANAARTIVDMVTTSRFGQHLQAVLTQGIAFAGFNVIDVRAIHEALDVPVIVVSRKQPDLAAIQRALDAHVAGAARKWQLIRRLGLMEPAGGVFIQCVGIDYDRAVDLVDALALNGVMPEPLRTAHLIAAGVVTGESRHRA